MPRKTTKKVSLEKQYLQKTNRDVLNNRYVERLKKQEKLRDFLKTGLKILVNQLHECINIIYSKDN